MKYLILIAALVLASCGALVSVLGLGHLFAGAGILVLVMVSGLEVSKVIGTAGLHRYWDKLSNAVRYPLTLIIVVMMMLTSLGIYGFLSDGYQKTASQYELEAGKIGILESKGAIFANRIVDNENIIESKTKRASDLSTLRAQQEVRLDSLYAKNYITNANKVRKDIESATEEIQKLNADVDEILVSNSVLADSVGVYNQKVLEVTKNSKVTAELGPLIYLAKLTSLSMDVIVNILIFIIIGVFDPAAVLLLILASSIRKIDETEYVEPTENPFEGESNEQDNYATRLANKFKNFKIPKTKTDSNKDDKPYIDPETGNIDLKYNGTLTDGRDFHLPSPDYSEEVDTSKYEHLNTGEDIINPIRRDESEAPKGIVAKGKIDAEDLELVRKNQKGRGYSVDVPEPKKITEAPEPTKLGKVWTKKNGVNDNR